MAELNFNAEEVQPAGTFEALPKADYLAMMVESEMKPTKSGDGEYLQCSWEVLEGEYKGRVIFDRLNLKNKNATAVKIAYQTLSAICHAIGVLHPRDSAELHGRPCIVKVALKERNDRPGEYSNEVKGYAAANGHKPSASAPTSSAPASKPPWKK